MTDISVAPVMSSTVEVFEDENSSHLLATLGNGNITTEAAYRKKLQIAAKYPNQDIQQCFHQVLREVTNPTVLDIENILEANQGRPRKKTFVKLEEDIIELLITKQRHQEEIRRKDEEITRLMRLVGQGTN